MSVASEMEFTVAELESEFPAIDIVEALAAHSIHPAPDGAYVGWAAPCKLAELHSFTNISNQSFQIEDTI